MTTKTLIEKNRPFHISLAKGRNHQRLFTKIGLLPVRMLIQFDKNEYIVSVVITDPKAKVLHWEREAFTCEGRALLFVEKFLHDSRMMYAPEQIELINNFKPKTWRFWKRND